MKIKVLVGGSANSPNYQVFEMNRKHAKVTKMYENDKKKHKFNNKIIKFVKM